MDKTAFGTMVDQTGLKLTDEQKTMLFDVYPMFQALVARSAPPMPREIEPSAMFQPEVK